MAVPSLTNFKEEIQSLKFRRGVVLFCPASDIIVGGDNSAVALNTAGIIRDTNIQLESVEFGPDNQNRTFVKAFDMNLQWVLMQTGAPELQNMSALANPAGNGLYIAITDGPFQPADPANIKYSDIDAESKVEFLNASVSPSIDLNFSREESGITSAVTGTIEVDDLTKLYAEIIQLA